MCINDLFLYALMICKLINHLGLKNVQLEDSNIHKNLKVMFIEFTYVLMDFLKKDNKKFHIFLNSLTKLRLTASMYTILPRVNFFVIQ